MSVAGMELVGMDTGGLSSLCPGRLPPGPKAISLVVSALGSDWYHVGTWHGMTDSHYPKLTYTTTMRSSRRVTKCPSVLQAAAIGGGATAAIIVPGGGPTELSSAAAGGSATGGSYVSYYTWGTDRQSEVIFPSQ